MAVATAGVGIWSTLQAPREPAKGRGGFIVWDGTSSVGSAAVQIDRWLGYTVYAVNSPKHDAYIKSLGATECFDYNDPDVVKTIVDSLKAANLKAELAYDAISDHGSSPKVAEIQSALGGGKLCLVLSWPEGVKKPDNFEVLNIYAAIIVDKEAEFSK